MYVRTTGPGMTRRTNSFEWSGGHPALDLVNTLDERPSDAPIDRLATYDDLVSFSELSGFIAPSAAKRLRSLGGTPRARVARRVRELREHLYDVLTALHA